MSVANGVSEGVDRRRFLRISAAAGMAGAAVVLDPVLFSGTAAASPEPAEETRVVTGRLEVGAPELVTDEGQVLLAPLDASGAGTVEWVTRPQLSAYVRAEVRRPDLAAPLGAMVALTNPGFLGRAHC